MDGNDSKTEIDNTLFGKYLAGEASPEEAMQLEDWLAKSAANKLLFEQYMAAWDGFRTKDVYKLPDTPSAWRQFNPISKAKGNTGFKRLLTGYGVAAAVAGIAILSIIILWLLNRTEPSASVGNTSFASVAEIKQNTLPDGSSIVLNSNSTLTFPEKFTSDKRETILEGEGYFSIKPDPKQPFVVKIENISIQVLGTSFNVRRNLQNGTIETQVSSGKVKMFNTAGEIFITAGQTGTYSNQSNSFLLHDTLDINSFSYATKNFVFTDEALSNIIKYLEKAYSKKILLTNELLGRCKMTSSFNNKPIEYILDVIAATLDITYSVDGNTIFLTGGNHEGC